MLIFFPLIQNTHYSFGKHNFHKESCALWTTMRQSVGLLICRAPEEKLLLLLTLCTKIFGFRIAIMLIQMTFSLLVISIKGLYHSKVSSPTISSSLKRKFSINFINSVSDRFGSLGL